MNKLLFLGFLVCSCVVGQDATYITSRLLTVDTPVMTASFLIESTPLIQAGDAMFVALSFEPQTANSVLLVPGASVVAELGRIVAGSSTTGTKYYFVANIPATGSVLMQHQVIARGRMAVMFFRGVNSYSMLNMNNGDAPPMDSGGPFSPNCPTSTIALHFLAEYGALGVGTTMSGDILARYTGAQILAGASRSSSLMDTFRSTAAINAGESWSSCMIELRGPSCDLITINTPQIVPRLDAEQSWRIGSQLQVISNLTVAGSFRLFSAGRVSAGRMVVRSSASLVVSQGGQLNVTGQLFMQTGSAFVPVLDFVPQGQTQIIIPLATFGSIRGIATVRNALMETPNDCYDVQSTTATQTTTSLSATVNLAPKPCSSNGNNSSVPLGVIVGAAVGAAVVVGVLIAVMVAVVKRRQERAYFKEASNRIREESVSPYKRF